MPRSLRRARSGSRRSTLRTTPRRPYSTTCGSRRARSPEALETACHETATLGSRNIQETDFIYASEASRRTHMRALLGILCLFSCAPAATASERADVARLARAAEVRAVLSEISDKRDPSDGLRSHDL